MPFAVEDDEVPPPARVLLLLDFLAAAAEGDGDLLRLRSPFFLAFALGLGPGEPDLAPVNRWR